MISVVKYRNAFGQRSSLLLISLTAEPLRKLAPRTGQVYYFTVIKWIIFGNFCIKLFSGPQTGMDFCIVSKAQNLLTVLLLVPFPGT